MQYIDSRVPCNLLHSLILTWILWYKQGKQGLKQRQFHEVFMTLHGAPHNEVNFGHKPSSGWMKSQFSQSFWALFTTQKNDGSPRALTPEPQKIKAFKGFHRKCSGQWWFFHPFFKGRLFLASSRNGALIRDTKYSAWKRYLNMWALPKSWRSQWTTLNQQRTRHPASGLIEDLKKRLPTPLKFKMNI